MTARAVSRVQWMTDAVTLATEAGITPISQRDTDLLLLFFEQGYTVAAACKSVFSVRYAYATISRERGNALSRN